MLPTMSKVNKKSSRDKTMEQITSLHEEDDERTTISKKISWILRRGVKSKKVNMRMTDDGWVKVSDLGKIDILDEIPTVKLMSIINESNHQKPRYDLKDSSEGQWIRAISKMERKEAAERVSRAVPRDRMPPSPGGNVKDASVMRTDAPEFVPAAASVGMGVSTGMAANPGFMQHPGAAAIPMRLPYPNPYAFSAAFPYPYGAYSPLMPSTYPPQPPPQQQAQQPLSSGRFRGRIKAFNMEKGFGFIECAEAHAQYGRDTFLHKAHIGDLTVGSEVTFAVELNKQGMPQARDLATHDGRLTSGYPGSPKGKGAKGCEGKGKSKASDEKGKGKGGGKIKGNKKGKDTKEKDKEKDQDKEKSKEKKDAEGGSKEAASAPAPPKAGEAGEAGEAAAATEPPAAS